MTMSDLDVADAHFRARLLADYDRLIRDYEEGLSRAGEKFGTWLTPMDGKLVLAALRTARDDSTPPVEGAEIERLRKPLIEAALIAFYGEAWWKSLPASLRQGHYKAMRAAVAAYIHAGEAVARAALKGQPNA